MGLCCSKPVIVLEPMTKPSVIVTLDPVARSEPIARPEQITMEQNPMIPPGQLGVLPEEDEITIVHIVTPDSVKDAVEVVVADPTALLPVILSAVEETIIVESRRDSMKATCVIERYKEAIGVIEKHSREPTAI